MLRTHTALQCLSSIGACLVLLAGPGGASAKPPKAKPAAAAPAPQPEAANEPDAPLAEPAGSELDRVPDPGPEPAPDPEPPRGAVVAVAAASGATESLDELRSEASALIDEMAQARAKAALLGKTLFKTQLRLRVQNLAAPDPRLTKLVLKLDGAPVFVGDGATLNGDAARQVFEGAVAPGRHVLTAELVQQSRADSSFGYSLHDSYRFKAQKDKLSELTLIVDDDSDLASEYPDDGDGEYDVRLKLRVRTKDHGEE